MGGAVQWARRQPAPSVRGAARRTAGCAHAAAPMAGWRPQLRSTACYRIPTLQVPTQCCAADGPFGAVTPAGAASAADAASCSFEAAEGACGQGCRGRSARLPGPAASLRTPAAAAAPVASPPAAAAAATVPQARRGVCGSLGRGRQRQRRRWRRRERRPYQRGAPGALGGPYGCVSLARRLLARRARVLACTTFASLWASRAPHAATLARRVTLSNTFVPIQAAAA